ncbi:hypothetical protein GCM10027568_00070 [Humibacter soli]
MDVGIRDLRNGLSRHLDAVKAGETITVTEHGRAIARIVPIDERPVLERLQAEGRLSPAVSKERALPEPIQAKGGLMEIVIEQRR